MKDCNTHRLKDVILFNQQQVEVNPNQDYKQIKVRLNQNGVELREIKKGSELGSKQYLAKQGQFIISKIDARNGAMGIVPEQLNNAVITGDFLLFDFNRDIINPKYFEYYTRIKSFNKICKVSSEGSTNRVRLKVDKFLNFSIRLPLLPYQEFAVSKIGNIKQRIEQIIRLRGEQARDINNLLFSKYTELIKNATWLPMTEVAPIIRREVVIKEDINYPELGIRSFGRGTFHKPTLSGIDVGTKKLYQIKTGDLMFSNVFAWEGAIAVAKEADNNRYGSHRFISCVPHKSIALSEYLCFHFLTEKGIEDINMASPGGAGRNKTLGLEKLMKILVPVPPIELQKEFIVLLKKMEALRIKHKQTEKELTELFPSFLDRVINNEF